jgi:lysyl-tRNA synthetase class 2
MPPVLIRFARVLALGPQGAWVWYEGRVQTRLLRDDPKPGDIVDLDSGAIVARASGPFPHPDGDFARLTERDGLRWNALHARARLLRAIRQFFDQRGFVEIDTPAIATSPGLELHLDAVEVRLRQGMGGPLTTRWLVTSPEYHCKRLLAAGMPKIYSLGHAFRSGERGTWHNPEFSMLEWYRAGEDYRAIVRDTRALVRHCVRALTGLPVPSLAQDLHAPWLRLSIRQAVQRFGRFDPGRGDDDALVRQRARAAGLEVADTDSAEDVLVRTLVERVEPALATLPGVVLDRWPASMASLARRFPRAPHLAERFEIYLRGIEIANGFSELVDATEQRQRFEADLVKRRESGRPAYPLDERFLLALEQGCPPAAGVALGVDRLLMVLGGYDDIEQVQAFPFERA